MPPIYAQEIDSNNNTAVKDNPTNDMINSTSATNSNMSTSTIRTDYDPVPENATGPVIPEKGYIVESLGDGLYYLSNGAYNTIFLVTEEGVIVVDAPPAIGEKYLQAIEEVTDKPVKYFIYSHTHKDHVGAADLFSGNVTYIAQ